MSKTRRTADEMFPLVERYLAGDQTQKAFTDEHGFSIAVFNYWLSKYRRQNETPEDFVEISLAPESSRQALLEICYPDGVRLRLFSLLPPDYLAQLLAARLR